MSVKSTILKVGGGFLLGTVGVNWLKGKSAHKAGAYTVAGVKIAADAVKDGFEKLQAGYGDLSADADEITKRYYENKDAKAEAEADGKTA